MKKFFALIISLAALLLTGCGGTAEKTDAPAQTAAAGAPTSKILVAYFSRAGDNFEVGVIDKGNTAIAAEMVAKRTGADLFEIRPVKEYPFDYKECTEVAKQEKAENARPAIAALVNNLDSYDVIFLGYPVWWSDLPMGVYTFLESQDFSGKTIIPFCTSAGEYMTGMEGEIVNHARGATLREGIGLRGKDCQDNPDAVRTRINAWLDQLGY